VSTAREIPTIIVVADESLAAVRPLREHGVEILAARDLTDALRQLRARGAQSLLVEGGAGLAGALLAEGHVDRLILIETPVVLGDGALDAFACVPSREAVLEGFETRQQRRLGEDLLKVLARRGADV
jgi:diaminohydroxyphosphoribosylaminopyrimidine deaminase/5-amino-6-(5-phosphoribosylamino)uracil reductase